MDFNTYLKNIYNQRIKKNPQYSVRAFARDLNVDQSTLTKIFNGNRPASTKFILKTAPLIGLTAAETKKYLIGNLKIKTPQYIDLGFEEFAMTADWYHDAILELVDTANFMPNPAWISKALDISVSTAKEAIQRLVYYKLLEINENGSWTDLSKTNSIHPNKLTNVALKTYQKQILKNSLNAIDKIPLAKRSHTSNTFSASTEKIEEAKVLIEKCRREVAALLRSSDKPKTEVFHLQISLFPSTSYGEGQ